MYIIALILFMDFLGFGLIIPLTPIFQDMYQLNPFQVGLFTAIFFIANLISGLILGPLSDKIGRRPILLFTTLGLSITYILNAVIQLYDTLNTFHVMLILRLIIGLFSGNIPLVFACSVDISSNNLEDRRKDMAILGAVIGLSFMLGPTLGGLFAEFTTSKTIGPFYFSGIVSLICFILVLLIFKETLPKLSNSDLPNTKNSKNTLYTTNDSSVLKNMFYSFTKTQFIIPLILYVVFFFSFTGFEVYLITVVLAQQLHLTQLLIGIFWSTFALCNSAFQFILLKLTKLKESLVLGFFIYAIGLLSYIFTSFSIWLVTLSMLICSVGIAFILPNISTLVSLEGSKNEQGFIFSINQSFGSMGRFLGPFLLGWIFDIFNNVNAIWIFMFILMIVQVILIIKFIPKDFKIIT